MKFSNYWMAQTANEEDKGQMFQNASIFLKPADRVLDDSWRRIVPLVSELRNSQTSKEYQHKSVDSATMAASRFISLIPDDILQFKKLIDFDVELDESIEFVFQGRQQVRVNLMLDSMRTKEEAFILYQRNGNQIQSNGYMAEVIEILKNVL